MKIERLQSNDIPQLLELYKELVPFESSADTATDNYRAIIGNEDYCLVVAKEDTEILGSALGVCCHSLTTPFLVIEDVIVKETERGKGIGRKIMAVLENFAKQKHCTYAILVSSDFRKPAHAFYESIGYTDGVRGFRKYLNLD